MLRRRLALILLVAVAGLSGLRAAGPQMSIDEIRPGMTGIGRTVFDGTHVEEFKVNILGVLENVIGPHRNLILARLEGGPLAQTGVIAGMSGSPVYIDGRLIGAVSYSLGQFSKEPIAGITPIAEMTDSTSFGEVRSPGSRAHIDFPLTPENLTAALRSAFDRTRAFASSAQDAQWSGTSAVSAFMAGQLGTLLRPIATPLVMSGFDSQTTNILASAFAADGFLPTGGSAGGFHAGEMPFEGSLKPGDAVGVMLVSGDLQLGGTGTVTEVDGDRVYAFGHPFYNLGPTEFPMTRAYVYTVLPSFFSSMKLSSTGEVIGTFLQDRATAIAGKLGPGPRMIPITLTLDSNRAPKQAFHFSVVNDQLLTPLATYVSLFNTLTSYQRQSGSATFVVHGDADVRKHEHIVFDNLFSGDQAATSAAAYIAGPLTYLLGNDYEKVDVDSVDLTITAAEEPKTATLERVWLDDPRPRVGRTVLLKVLIRTYRGEDVVRTLPIDIPANANGELSLTVSDGLRLGQVEQREARPSQQPRSVDQIIKSLNKARRNNTLYVDLVGRDSGAVVNGERMPSLPPAVLGVIEADRSGGDFNPLAGANLGEWELPTEQAVSGARTLTIVVLAKLTLISPIDMLKFRVREGILALAVIFALAPLHASSPQFFQASTQPDFLKGEVENLSIDSRGQLVLGPATELVYETSAPFLWSTLAEPDGTLLIGTGNEGKVFKIDPQGKGSLFFASPELEVHALARAANGSLYVATSPDGKIYRLDSSGAATVFFDPGEKYIWALAVDRAGNVYAGTGGKGAVYKITPDGKGAIFYRTNATHATALVFDAAGNLIVGTSSPGRILRIDQNAKGFVLLDSPYQEIHALRFDDNGLLYAAAVSGRPGGLPSAAETSTNDRASESSPTLTPSVSTEVTSVVVVDGSGGAPSIAPARENPGRAGSRGAVYRIAPDGVWDELWESRDDSPYDVMVDQGGALIIGTGNKGKIYRLEGDPPQPTLLARANAQQVTSFFKDANGRLYYATANPGKLFRLSSQRSTRGTYESEARDAQTVAAWGALNWRGTATGTNRIELFTRSGNTGTPDDTWSPWSAAYSSADGSPITSPKARFLQWRAVLTGSGGSPILTSVRAAYLQRNLRPQVHSTTVYPPGIVFQKAFPTGDPDLAGFDNQTTPERKMAAAAAAPQIVAASPPVGRRSYQKGLQTLVWRADDENDDELVYDVLYRREGDVNWKMLRRDIPDSILVWDTTTVPNGTYFVKIVASDSPSNPVGTALTGELDSIAFEIDNTPPVILIKSARFEGGHTFVSFDVKDADSTVKRVEFSQDGLQWHSAFPVDGIADSREEHYELMLDGALGDRGLTLRAADALDNVATAHVDPPPR